MLRISALRHKSLIIGLFIAITVTSCFLVNLAAHASLTIAPLRVTFTGRDRTAEVMLINASTDVNTYRVGWMYNRQTEDGTYKEQAEPLNAEYNPAEMILFSPRQVTIPGGRKQRIRMSLRRPPELPDGEYRAHMKFQKLAPQTDPKLQKQPERGMSMAITVNLGFSIPVVVRQGNYDAAAEIIDVKFVAPSTRSKGKPLLKVTMNRTGIHSTIGRIRVFWQKPGTNEEIRVGRANNVAIYTEINTRTAFVTLQESTIAGGQLRVVYEGDGPDRGIVFDEKIIPVGN